MSRPHPEQRTENVCGFEFDVLDPRHIMPGEPILHVGRYPEQSGDAGAERRCCDCGETVIVRTEGVPGPTSCGICAIARMSMPGSDRAAFLADLRTMRVEDPELLKAVILACLQASGAARVAPRTETL